MDSNNHSLRVALVWNGTIYQERFFTRIDEHVVTMGDEDDNVFSLPAPGLPDSLEVFERQEQGFKFRFTDQVGVTLHINGEEYDREALVDNKRAVGTGSARTDEGQAQIYEMDLNYGDWGIIDLGRIQIFFQCMERAGVLAGRSPGEMIDGPLAMMLILALLLHGVFLIAAFLQPPTPQLEELAYEDRFAEFAVDDIEDAADEEEEDDAAAEKMEEDEGEFGDPEEEVEEEIPEVDEDQVDEIDVDELGVHEALDMDDGPLDDLFADDGMDAELPDMVGDGDMEIGRGEGGAGLRGDGAGGGGEGYGTVGGLGGVDEGGTGAGGEVGAGEQREPPPVDRGSPDVGDFCDPGDIQRVVGARSDAIQHCFDRRLQTDPSLSGNLTMNWRVELDGSVSNVLVAESTIADPEVEGCITRVIERMRFAEPDGGMCDINYPFVFTGLE